MKTEKSCGAVVFTVINNSVKYVIVESKEGYFGFPKGHIEKNETEKETALREIREETGLNVDIIDGFKTEDLHTFTLNGETRMKHVVCFLAQYSNQSPSAQISELNSIKIIDFDTAMPIFQFESSKKILSEANKFITKHLQIL